MYHHSNAIQDTKGNALIGFWVKCVSKTDGSTIALYADVSGTPIETVSGEADMAKVNSDGNAQFYVGDGDYHIDVYATDKTTFVKRYEDISMTRTGIIQADSVADMAQMDTAYAVILTASGQQGIFYFESDDLSAQVSADPQQTTYVAPSSDTSGSSGAWVRASTSNVGTVAVDHETARLTGCQIAYSGTGLTLTMSAGTYKIDGIQYSAQEQTVTLATADPLLDRIDVLFLDSTGVLQKITGTAAASPSAPQVDPTTQLYLTFVSVPAAATALPAITTATIYDEGGVGEWTATTSGSGLTVGSTNNPNTGTHSLEGTAVTTGSYFNFATTPFTWEGDGMFMLSIRSKASWNRNRFIRIEWLSGGTVRGNSDTFRDGVYGFVSSNTSSYQQILIPKSNFNIAAGTTISTLRLTISGSGGSAIGFYIDPVQLQTFNGTIGNPQQLYITQADADARYLKLTGGTVTGPIILPARAYDATTWNGSLRAATEDAVRDKIEALAPGGVISGALLPANNLSDVASASTSRTNLGLGTMATQSASNVAITGGSVTGITDLAVADGGTGASTAANARTNLGLGSIATQESSNVTITGGSVTGITDLAVADGGTGSSTASGARTNLGLGTISTLNETTAAEYQANTSGKALSTDKVWSAATTVTLAPGTNVAVDMSTGLNFTLAMGGNYTLSNPTNAKPGQSGFIKITQDGTGSRTLAYGANWLFAGGTDPTLSTAASSKDVLYYTVISSTEIHGNLVKALA